MRKFLVLSALAGLYAVPVQSQEVYQLQATANQAADLALIVTANNGRTCERLSTVAAPLTETCTQAQACTNAAAAGGASCTAAQARAANARIFPATQAGREEFVTFVIVAPRFQDMKAAIVGRDREKMCQFWSTATTGQKNTACAAVGRSAGCELCP